MNDLDNIIIPPLSELADNFPISIIINNYIISKQGPPESNSIQYILND